MKTEAGDPRQYNGGSLGGRALSHELFMNYL